MIKIKTLGAGREVGRSGFLVNYKKSNILLDYGLKINPGFVEFPLHPEVKIHSVILSHSHFDHCGNIPSIMSHSNPLLYMTAPTSDIANILWQDAIKIANHEGNEPPYTQENINDANRRTQLISYKQEAKTAPDINIKFFDAGHVIGSAQTQVEFIGGKSLLYTGDYKLDETRLQNGADLNIENVDYMIVESTYGNKDHPPRDVTEKDFTNKIKAKLENGGSVIIASFAVGRAQEIVDILNEYKIHGYPIYLDGMGQKVANVYMKYPGYYKNPYELREALGKTIWIKNHKMRMKAIEEQCIIITTAGMLEGGPVLFYLKHLHANEKNALYLTGFQVEGTKGNILLTSNEIEIEGKLYKPKLDIERFNFSAHIGKKDLMKSIGYWNPQKVMCVHGDASVIEDFTHSIKEELGIEAVGPKVGETVIFDSEK